jgi:hypothetical protein
MQDKLIEFIREEFLSDPDTKIDENTKLISTGLIDSFSLVLTQKFIEMSSEKKYRHRNTARALILFKQ